MTNSIYLTTTEPHAGKSLVSLGITELLLRKTKKVAIFRPIISARSAEQRDKNIDLLFTHFKLDIGYEDSYAFLRREATDLIGQGRYDEVLDKIIQKFKALESQYDFILCIGSDFEEGGPAFEFDVNADMAKNSGLAGLDGRQRCPARRGGGHQFGPCDAARFFGKRLPGVGRDRELSQSRSSWRPDRRFEKGFTPPQ